MVSVLPLEFVSVNTDLKRFLPLDSPFLVLTTDMVFFENQNKSPFF